MIEVFGGKPESRFYMQFNNDDFRKFRDEKMLENIRLRIDQNINNSAS